MVDQLGQGTTSMPETIIEGYFHAQLGHSMRCRSSYEAQDTPAGRLCCEQEQEKLNRDILLLGLDLKCRTTM